VDVSAYQHLTTVTGRSARRHKCRSAVLMSPRPRVDEGVMSYREWRTEYRRRTARTYVNSYPWSAFGIGVALGVAGALIFGNVLAGAAGA